MATIQKRRKPKRAPQEPVEDLALWQSELGRYIETEADERISIESVRQTLAAISGPLAADVSAERDRR
jgi:hypothetical protein